MQLSAWFFVWFFFFLRGLQLYSALCYSLNVVILYVLYSTSLVIIPVITSICCKLAEWNKLLPHSLYSHCLCQVLPFQYLLGYLEVYFQYHNPKVVLTGISSVAPATFRSLLVFFPPALIFPVLLNCSAPLLSFSCFCPTSCTTISLFQCLPISPVFHHPLPTSGTQCVGNLGLFPRPPLFITPSTSALLPDSDIQITAYFTVSRLCLAYRPVKSHFFFFPL